MVLAMLTVPCYAQQEVPDSVQYYIEQPAVKVEDFQSMEAGELISGIMEKAKEPIREPIRLVIALMAGGDIFYYVRIFAADCRVYGAHALRLADIIPGL